MRLLQFFRKGIFLLISTLLLPALALLTLCDLAVSRSAQGLHGQTIEEVPTGRVALVPGCSPILSNGRTNRYFTNRIDAAAELFQQGKCHAFLVSGDHSREDYNEPAEMKLALIARGVPSESIICDDAGLSTQESVFRAKAHFQLDSIVIVSQRFHNQRALFFAKHIGIEAYGWDAKDVNRWLGFKTRARESLARTKAVFGIALLSAQNASGKNKKSSDPS
jgi:SanA protein